MQEREIDIADVLTAIKRYGKYILLVPTLLGICVGIYSFKSQSTYESSSLIWVQTKSVIDTNSDTLAMDMMHRPGIDVRMNNYLAVITSDAIRNKITDEGLSTGYRAEIIKGSEMIKIVTQASTPENAQKANQMIIALFQNKIEECKGNSRDLEVFTISIINAPDLNTIPIVSKWNKLIWLIPILGLLATLFIIIAKEVVMKMHGKF